MITQIIIGIIMVLVGILIVVFSEQIFNFTGSIGFVENHFPGNSRAFIKLMGILLVLLGVMTFSGLWAVIFKPLGSVFFRPL